MDSLKNEVGNGINSDQNDIQVAEMDEHFLSLAQEYFNPVIDRFCREDLFPLKNLITIFERAVLIKCLSNHNGNQKKTADFLGLKLSTLHEKIKKHNIHFRKEPY